MSNLDILNGIIANRRTVKPASMNGKLIEESSIHTLLQLADWAPTHGHTEPWRFFVYTPLSKSKFCADHAALYKQYTAEDKFMQASYEKLFHMADTASHVIVVVMKKGNNPKIPVQEELIATACAIQNILLGCAAAGIAAYWGTGGMTYHPKFKEYFGLDEKDLIAGTLYLGYSDERRTGKRLIPLNDKISWG
ncbi:MAG: nitroreductase [Chitinophagaceae bacterium]|nr:nitroreductase [Chitinophagaceae bacterium]